MLAELIQRLVGIREEHWLQLGRTTTRTRRVEDLDEQTYLLLPASLTSGLHQRVHCCSK